MAKISGETVVILSGVGVRVSGESVRISPESGRGKVELHAYDLSGLVWTPLAVDTSGGTALKIAGSFSANISGQVVSTSGGVVKISGETVTVNGTVAVTSGTGVRVSGETISFLSGIGVRISGEAITFLSGIGVRVSGESVRLSTESGRTLVQLRAYDLSGLAWNDLAVDVSGGNALRIPGSFSANISGQVVSVSGGVAKISGETVTVNGTVAVTSGTGVRVSGETITFLSGIGVRISGEAITFLSGIGVRVSGESVRISPESGRASAELKAYDLSGLAWNNLAVDVSGGNALRIAGSFAANISGQVVSTEWWSCKDKRRNGVSC